MKASEILKAAKAKIATPETWTQGVYATDKYANVTTGYDRSATCFCSVGALQSVMHVSREREDAYDILRMAMGRAVPLFNDNHTHAEVMAKWDEAIALAEAEEAANATS